MLANYSNHENDVPWGCVISSLVFGGRRERAKMIAVTRAALSGALPRLGELIAGVRHDISNNFHIIDPYV